MGLALSGDGAAAVVIVEAFAEREEPHLPLLNRYEVRHAARLPMGMAYAEIVADIGALLRQPPLYQPDLVLDESKVGSPVAGLFAELRPVRVVITPGQGEAALTGHRRYEVPRALLLSILGARLHDGSLRFAVDLEEASALAAELKQVRADEPVESDLVTALALSVWRAVGKKASFYRSPRRTPNVIIRAPR